MIQNIQTVEAITGAVFRRSDEVVADYFELSSDEMLLEDINTFMFHLLEGDFECVGADRRYSESEFPDDVIKWYQRISADAMLEVE